MKSRKFLNSIVGIIVIAVIATTILLVGGIFYTISLRNTLRNQQKVYILEIASRAAVNFKIQAEKNLTMLNSLSAIFSTFYSYASLDDYLGVLDDINKNNNFRSMGIFFPDSNNAYFSTGETLNGFLPQYLVYKVLRGEKDISEVVMDEVLNEPILIYAVPFVVSGRVQAIVFATQAVSDLQKVLERYKIAGEGFTMLINQQGDIVVDSKEKLRLVGQSIKDIFAVSNLDNDEDFEHFIEKLQSGEVGVVGYELKKTKQHRYLSYVKINAQGVENWYIAFVVPSSSLSKQIKKIIMLSFIFSLAILCTFILILIFIDKREHYHQTLLFNTAFKDKLTGASNVGRFQIDMQKSLKEYIYKNFALIILDIDKFKVINDLYGNRQGDLVLTHVANVLEDNTDTRFGEIFARLMGDNFLLLLAYDTQDEITTRLDKIYEQIKTCYAITDMNYEIRSVFGIYKVEDDLPFYLMLDRASLAKKMAKQAINKKYMFYDETSFKRVLDDKEIENNMNIALKDEKFILYMQPKCAFDKNKVEGAEVLIRWETEKKGLISPSAFIPVFESNGFILKLDMYILEHTLKTLQSWIDKGLKPCPVSINLSRLHLNDELCIDKIGALLKDYKVPTSLIEFELTESAFAGSTDKIKTFIDDLHKLGVKVSMDDFGSGYSSLNSLKDLPFDTLKIDKEFVHDLENNTRSPKVLEGIIKMLKTLGATIVVEGVETEKQVNLLKNLNCDLAQGYFYYKPLTLDEFEKLLPKSEEIKK